MCGVNFCDQKHDRIFDPDFGDDPPTPISTTSLLYFSLSQLCQRSNTRRCNCSLFKMDLMADNMETRETSQSYRSAKVDRVSSSSAIHFDRVSTPESSVLFDLQSF